MIYCGNKQYADDGHKLIEKALRSAENDASSDLELVADTIDSQKQRDGSTDEMKARKPSDYEIRHAALTMAREDGNAHTRPETIETRFRLYYALLSGIEIVKE